MWGVDKSKREGRGREVRELLLLFLPLSLSFLSLSFLSLSLSPLSLQILFLTLPMMWRTVTKAINPTDIITTSDCSLFVRFFFFFSSKKGKRR